MINYYNERIREKNQWNNKSSIVCLSWIDINLWIKKI